MDKKKIEIFLHLLELDVEICVTLGQFCECIKVPEHKTSRRKDVRATYNTRRFVLNRATILRLFYVYTKSRERSTYAKLRHSLRLTYLRPRSRTDPRFFLLLLLSFFLFLFFSFLLLSFFFLFENFLSKIYLLRGTITE